MKICPSCHEGFLPLVSRCPGCSADLSSTYARSGSDLTGMLIEKKYRLEKFVEEGGMGWVYRGRHLRLESDVAIKLMKPLESNNEETEKREKREQRFEQEARTASRLQHPHVISILDFGRTAGDLLYIVSEFVTGITLTKLMQQAQPLPLPRILRIFFQILAAIEAAHRQRVIHRDLKPDNIMVMQLSSGEDFVKVLDFGIATVQEAQCPPLTTTGSIFGTPSYMAPEQISAGASVTQTCDLYACGIILFELLTGKVPFEGDTIQETLSQQLSLDPPSVLEHSVVGDLPDSFEHVLRRTLAKDPLDRYQSAAELRMALLGASNFPVSAQISCSACHRQISSPLDYCSDHCARINLAAHADSFAPLPPSVMINPRLSPTLVDGEIPDTLQIVSHLAPQRGPDVELVGRKQELRSIHGFLDGPRTTLQITGAMGMGRTMMLQEVEKLARARGYTVLRTGADPSLAQSPWYPVTDLVRQALDLTQQAIDRSALRDRAREAGLEQEDIVGLTTLLFPTDGPDGEVPLFELTEMIHSAIRAVLNTPTGRERPCFLLDDLDAFDSASLSFVRVLYNAVTSSSNGAKLVMVSTATMLGASDDRLHIHLRPLQEEDTLRLLQSGLASRPNAASVDMGSLVKMSGGNPLHAVQLLRLLEQGPTDLDPRLERLIQMRLARLPPAALHLLQVVSVFGLRARLSDLRQLQELHGSITEGATVLIEQGMIRLGAPDGLYVGHPTIANIVYETIPKESRRLLHRQVLGLLERSGESVTALARHAFAAGLEHRSLDLQERAGDLAQSVQDHESAAMLHYRRAQQVARWELLMSEEGDRYIGLSVKLARSLRLSGHHLSAEMVLNEALSRARRHPQKRAELLLEMGRLHRVRSRPQEATEALTDAIQQALETACDSELTVEMYIELAGLHAAAGNLLAAIQVISDGLLLVTRGAPGQLWRLSDRLAHLLLENDDPDPALEAAQRALDGARKRKSLIGRAQCHLTLSHVLVRLERADEAIQHLTIARRIYRQLGFRRKTAECLLLQAGQQPQKQGLLISKALALSKQVQWDAGIEQAQRLEAVHGGAESV